MNDRPLDRRRMLLGIAGVAALPLIGSRTGFAQTPAAGPQSVTTETYGKTITWTAAWQRDEAIPLVDETDLLDAESDEVIDTVAFDHLVLENEAGAFGEFVFAPSPATDERWEIDHRWTDLDGYVSIDSGELADFWYELDVIIYEDEEYGRFLKGTYPTAAEFVSTVVFTAPIASFGTEMEAFLADVTLDGAPPYDNVDPAALQALLDPLAGKAMETYDALQAEAEAAGDNATPEASPAA
jgi:hypothetical protein